MKRSNLPQLRDSPHIHPFRYKMLPSLSKAASCGQTNFPALNCSRVRVRSMHTSLNVVKPSPELRHNLVFFIDQRHDRIQIRNHHQIFPAIEMPRRAHRRRQIAVMFAIQRKRMQPAWLLAFGIVLATTTSGSFPRTSQYSPCG